MSGRILHELAFRLHAQRSSAFDRAFGGAGQRIAEMQQQLQGLNRAQRDISSYQRQQQAVDRTRQRLEGLQRQHDLLQREISETTGNTAGLERQSLRLQERINSTSDALNRQQQRLQQTSEALRQAGVNTDNLTAESIRLAEEMRDVQRAQERAAQGAGAIGSAFDAAGQAIAAAGVYTALRNIYGAYQDCLNLAGEFESGMSNISALSGAGAEDMFALSEQAKALGATTKFTASESAAAMGYMAMAGWDAEDMLSGMDGVLQLAAASGEELALVSDIVTDSMSAFHLRAEDTSRFADVLAAAATNANTNVAIMGETFKGSASVAGALGYSIEDVAVAVGLMANNGVKGSIAGTALKNTFNGLLDGVTLTSEAFGEYEYSAVRADGTMKSFGSTIEELRGYFEQMTEAERVSNAMNIAGAYGYNGLLGILLSADEDYNKLTNSINNCAGAAERMAQIKLDNLQGDITLAQSAADALKISVGEQFLPMMRLVYQEGTELLGQMDNWVQANPGLVKAGAAFVSIMGSAAVSVTGVSAAVRILQALNVAALFTGPTGAILGLSAALAAGVAGFVALKDGATDVTPSCKELTSAAREAEEAMQDADAVFAESQNQTLAAAEVAEHYIDKLEQMGDGEKLEGEAKQEYLNTLTLLCRTMPELNDIVDTQTGKIEGGTEALRANTEAWRENAIEQAKQQRLAGYADAVAEAELSAAEISINLTDAKDKQQMALAEAAEIRRRQTELRIEAEQKAEQAAASPYARFDPDADRWETYLGEEYFELDKQLAEVEKEAARQERAAKNFEAAWLESSAKAGECRTELDKISGALDQLGTAAGESAEAAREGATALDQSAVAAASARSTMQAYIDGLNGMRPQVKAAFANISSLLPQSGALQLALNGMLMPAAIEPPEPTAAYAAGTNDAARGWALVGEQGPELLFMQGGETVLPNSETERILTQSSVANYFNSINYFEQSRIVDNEPNEQNFAPIFSFETAEMPPVQFTGGGDNMQISIAPVYNISGGAASDPAALENILQQQNSNLRELILETFADWQTDCQRLRFMR